MSTRANLQTAVEKKKKDLFSDFFTDFAVHPNTQELSRLTNEQAVRRSLRNIILTNQAERLFNPRFGCNIRNLLFEEMSDMTANAIQGAIQESITNYEPRAKVLSIAVNADPNNNAYQINITYIIVNMKEPSNLTVTLYRVR